MKNSIVDIFLNHDLKIYWFQFFNQMSQKSCQIPTKAIKFYMNVYALPCENMESLVLIVLNDYYECWGFQIKNSFNLVLGLDSSFKILYTNWIK
jgi:hypothetical protein